MSLGFETAPVGTIWDSQWRLSRSAQAPQARRRGVCACVDKADLWLTKSFVRKSDAQEWARGVEHKIDAGEHVPNAEARKRTLGEAIKRYLEITLPRSKHRKNASEQTRLLEWWKDQLASRALVALTPAVIAEARDELAKAPTRNPRSLPARPSIAI